jgi:TonB family protein
VLSRISVAVAAVLLTASLAGAQTVVAGQVIHRSKRAPLANVAVELLGVRDTVLATATSSGDGTFTLGAPAGGTYRVRLIAPGALPHVSDSLVVKDNEYAAREFAIDPEPRALTASEVDRPAMPARASPTARYPVALRDRHISGCALVQFVVDTTGRADTTTFTVLKVSGGVEFAHAVRDALPGMRFTPAQLGGRNVPQLVQMPFDFEVRAEQRRVVYDSVRAPVRDIRRTAMPPAEAALPPPSPTRSPRVCGSGAR